MGQRRWLAALAAMLLTAWGAIPAMAQADPTLADPAAACAGIAKTNFTGLQDAPTGIISAQVIRFQPWNKDYGPKDVDVCQVEGSVSPTIQFKIVMPMKGWNGKYLQGGCGGACGTTKLFWCDDPLRRGYACLGSDMGHAGSVADWHWGGNDLQLRGDFGYRSTHVAAIAGKAVVAAFYGRAAHLSYFYGCSTGGRQAYHEAEFFPTDFAGIVGDSPPLNETGSAVQLAWTVRANMRADGSEILGVAEAELLHRAVVAACDMNDGIKDGAIGDPRQCKFRPATLACASSDAKPGTCLTPEQVVAANKFYAGPTDSKGQAIGHQGGVMPGSELFWIGDYIDGPTHRAQYRIFIADVFRYMAFNPAAGPSWKLSDLDFDHDPARLAVNETAFRADNPDLRGFRDAGGKFLGFQGWSDTSIVPLGTTDFYQTVTRTMGGQAATRAFFRFYAIPGMRHCSADGDGGDAIDQLSALEAWVEKGQAPDRLIGYNYDWRGPATSAPVYPLDPARVRFARPHYPYPDEARYQGHGDPNDAANWKRVIPVKFPE
jgi:hypothetical protein